jgi:hypothetical protein
MNNVRETRKEIRQLTRELEAKLETLSIESDNDEVCGLLDEANQNVINILGQLQSELTYLTLNAED